jgi:hypothetical protein
VKEFLDNLYKQCVSSRADGVDQLFDVIIPLCSEKKFEAVDSIIRDMILSRVSTSAMYTLLHLTYRYINYLPSFKSKYKEIREEFARRGEPSERINNLFDRYEDIPEKELYNPDAPQYKSPSQKSDELLDEKIKFAKEIGDKDLENFLTFYKAQCLRKIDSHDKFHNLRMTVGDDELRKRTIKALRDMADLLDKSTGSWPGIYYCDLPEDPLLKKTFIDGLEVIISYPWPG